MYTERLTESLSIAAVLNPQTGNNQTINSGNGIDASKLRRLMAVILIGNVTGGGSITAKLRAAKTSGGTFTDITGANITAMTTTNQQATIEVREDQLQTVVGAGYQYVRLELTEGGSQNVVVGAVLLASEAPQKPVKGQLDLASVAQRVVA
jgi:hypothetical protein